jgi:hypothetical protein
MTIQPNERFGTSGGSTGGPGAAGTSGAGSTLGGDGRGVTSQVQQKAEELMDRAGHSARSKLDDGKQRAARELGTVAHALHQCGTDLNNDREAVLAPYVSRVADQVERFSNFIDTHSAEDLAHEVEGFARRNPALFLGSCFALGIVAARFLKSSRPDLPVRYDEQQRVLERAEYRTSSGFENASMYTGEAGGDNPFRAGSSRSRDL